MAKFEKPSLCTHPDCFSCPYKDCRYEQMTVEEYVESNKRDKEYKEPLPLMEYKQRSFDCSGRKEYYRNYYQKNREHKNRVSKEYRKRTNYKVSWDHRREYYKQWYSEHREEKIAKMKERSRIVKEALNATR